MIKKLASILLITILSSCYSYDDAYYQPKQNSNQISQTKTTNSFFWGLQDEELPSNDKCDKETVIIKNDNGFLNYLARIYTLGIYWPRTTELKCKIK